MVVNKCATSTNRSFMAREVRKGCRLEQDCLSYRFQVKITNSPQTGSLPHYLSSDNDPLFEFHHWKANFRVLEIAEVKTVPYVPLSHPFVERLIGTIRREFLDFVPFWNAHDLRQKLHDFHEYYNCSRVHRARDGFTPDVPASTKKHRIARLDDYRWENHCGGLYQLPAAA